MQRQWVEMFPCIVGKTYTTDVISTGIGGNKSGSLLLVFLFTYYFDENYISYLFYYSMH